MSIRCLLLGHKLEKDGLINQELDANIIRKGYKVGEKKVERKFCVCERCKALVSSKWEIKK